MRINKFSDLLVETVLSAVSASGKYPAFAGQGTSDTWFVDFEGRIPSSSVPTSIYLPRDLAIQLKDKLAFAIAGRSQPPYVSIQGQPMPDVMRFPGSKSLRVEVTQVAVIRLDTRQAVIASPMAATGPSKGATDSETLDAILQRFRKEQSQPQSRSGNAAKGGFVGKP